MISMAFENDMVSGKTLKVFRLIKKQSKKSDGVRDRILTRNEFEALVNHSTEHLKAIVAAGYYTGMRKGEILNLTWDKVDLKNRLIHLEPEDTKDREARTVPIGDELYEYFRKIPNKIQKAGTDNYVFVYRGQPVNDIRKGLRDACAVAGIKYGRNVKDGFVFHDLRHTFNTNMRKAGVVETVIMRVYK